MSFTACLLLVTSVAHVQHAHQIARAAVEVSGYGYGG